MRKLSVKSRTADKASHLENIIGRMNSAIVAYSGGVDSTFLSVTAVDILKDKVQMVLARSSLMQAEELEAARKLAFNLKLNLIEIEFNQLDIPDFAINTRDRCYHCKLNMLGILNETARVRHIKYVCDGTNYDDLSDHRPGLVAIAELGVRSPLAESFLTKEEIRALARTMGLPNWKKPSTSKPLPKNFSSNTAICLSAPKKHWIKWLKTMPESKPTLKPKASTPLTLPRNCWGRLFFSTSCRKKAGSARGVTPPGVPAPNNSCVSYLR